MLEPKPAFRERIEELMGLDESKKYFQLFGKHLQSFIRCNTLKISPSELVKKLKRWKIEQPFHKYPEIMIVQSELAPGELGKATEHLLGYYYIQDVSSMMPSLVLEPTKQDIVLDLCAAPGSKTTQIAARMENSGLLIANDNRSDRINILATNLERSGVTNTIVTKQGAENLVRDLTGRIKFDKILVDTSCSGEGVRDLKTLEIWNFNMIRKFAKEQKKLISAAISILKENGILVYSTCTLTPEENESVIQYALDNFPVEIEKIELPLKSRDGILEWKEEKFSSEMKNVRRIYPQDNDAEGFFVAKLRKVGK